MSSCDDIEDDEWDMFGDIDDTPLKSSLENSDMDSGIATTSTVQPFARQEVPERAPVPTPLDSDRLHALFSEYEKLVNEQEARREHHGSPVKRKTKPSPEYLPRLTYSRFVGEESRGSDHPESGHQAIPRAPISVAREQQRGILKRKTQRRKKSTSRGPSRTKRALASSIQEYEYMQLGEARRAPNGSIEVEVFWAPIFLPCDQLRGEQAIEEAKDLVIRKFGHVAWERERSKFDCVDAKAADRTR